MGLVRAEFSKVGRGAGRASRVVIQMDLSGEAGLDLGRHLFEKRQLRHDADVDISR
jgi:hypothetical protein